MTIMSNTDIVTEGRPQIYFKKIKFNDETELTLERNSIVVFTGANNSGKSQVLLLRKLNVIIVEQ